MKTAECPIACFHVALSISRKLRQTEVNRVGFVPTPLLESPLDPPLTMLVTSSKITIQANLLACINAFPMAWLAAL